MSTASVRDDFDEIARLSGERIDRTDRYDRFLSSLVPSAAASVLDVGCAMAGRLLPGSRILYHWHWRYTIVWDPPSRAWATRASVASDRHVPRVLTSVTHASNQRL